MTFYGGFVFWIKTNFSLISMVTPYVFRGQSFPLYFGVSVTGIFNDLAAVAFLPPPHSTFAALRLAAVSPTAKSLKIRSNFANNVTGKQLPP